MRLFQPKRLESQSFGRRAEVTYGAASAESDWTGGTNLEEHKTTTMFGQFKYSQIDEMALSLDKRLLTFLTKASQ